MFWADRHPGRRYSDSFPEQQPRLTSPAPQDRPFFNWAGYDPHPMMPHKPMVLPTRREEFIDAVANLEGEGKRMSVIKSAGQLAKPAVSHHARPTRLLSYFFCNAKRSLLVPRTPSSFPAPHSQPAVVDSRDLQLLESELFDTAKHVGTGGSSANHLTVLTWSSDSPHGTITLFEVDLVSAAQQPSSYTHPLYLQPPPQLPPPPPSALAGRRRTSTTTTTSRRRPAPPPLNLALPYHQRQHATAQAIRPIAAMEDVPRQVLVNMRTDGGIRKQVLRHDAVCNRFRWTAQHTARPPSYARVSTVATSDMGPETRLVVHTAMAAGFRFDVSEDKEEDWQDGYAVDPRRGGGNSTWRRSSSRRSRSERSWWTVENPRSVRSWEGRRKEGVVATMPQFLALLHASRTIIEAASSASAACRVETDEGERVRAVSLHHAPRGKRHLGRDVHVVVLVPDGASWANERMFWTDGVGGLVELRQKKYKNVVEGGRPGRMGPRGGGERDWNLKNSNLERTRSPPPPRTARW